MVLSNKKLKQKLRAAKAELLAASEDENNLNSRNLDSKTMHSLRNILNPEARKPKISKREKRRQKSQKENVEIIENGEISGDAEGQKQDGSKSDAVEVNKKRKRDESKASEDVKEKKLEQLKKTKNPRKKKKPKKEVGEKKVKEKGVEQNGSGATGEQLVAKTDESIDRNVEISTKVYVGGIPYYSTEDDIRSYFEGCGTITNADCMMFPDTGKFRGIAIITFKTEAGAKRALALDGSDMGGLFLKIEPFKSTKVNKLSNFSPSVLEGYNRIYVGNLSWDITENDLRKLFADCTITSIRFGEDKETGEFKGYAHVDFADSLSLNMALKLDQSIVCGRPVRISCAVPKKGTVTKSPSMPKDNQVVGSKVTAVDENQVNSSEVNAVSSKIRRRTCYECGERGHLSSSCLKKQAADTKLEPLLKDDRVESGSVTAVDENQVNGSGANAVSSKIRRRTCYECGECGHLSSSCPKIQTADTKSESMPKDDQVDSGNVTAVDETQVNISEVNAVSSKIRRRTCYECGERGHLSSSCPKKQAADLTNPGAT